MNGEKRAPYLYAAIALLSIIATCFLIALVFVLFKDIRNGTSSTDTVDLQTTTLKSYCLSPGCRQAAISLIFSMNPKVDPCKDFYEFACGRWTKLNPIEENHGRRSAFSLLQEKNLEQLKTFLNQLGSDGQLDAVDQLLLRVYKSCMDEGAIEEAGAGPAKQMLDDIFKRDVDDGSLELLLARAWKDYGSSVIVTSFVAVDMNLTDPDQILFIDQASLGLGFSSEDYYLKNDTNYVKVREAYLNLTEEVFHLLYEPSTASDKAKITSMARDVFEFEISLARLNTPAEKRRNFSALYNKRGVDDLRKFGRHFDYVKYINYLAPGTAEVNVVQPDYFEKLDSLIEKTPVLTVRKYVEWRLIFSRLAFMEKKYSDKYYQFLKLQRDQGREKDRFRFCIAYLQGDPDDGSDYLGYAIGRLFIAKSGFNETSRAHVNLMVDRLKDAFKELLLSNIWMDDETKRRAEGKVAKMISSIGYPDLVHNLSHYYDPLLQVQPGYSDLVIQPVDGFFTINNKFWGWLNQKRLKDLKKKLDKHRFGGSPAIVNAWYSPTKNSIVFPAGILQQPFFDDEAPAAINYGAIGSVIGHEITHGFDDQGAQFNKHGTLENWWSNASAAAFATRVECIKSQYSKFCYPHLGEVACVKGENTKGENIADNGGIKQSFAAYKAATLNESEQVLLPGLEDFSMDQIFFLSFASFWCSSYKDNYLKNMLETNVHSPGRDRVIGTLQNFDQFSLAFRCPVGSKMNPKTKCSVW